MKHGLFHTDTTKTNMLRTFAFILSDILFCKTRLLDLCIGIFLAVPNRFQAVFQALDHLKPMYLKLVKDSRWGAEQVSGNFSGIFSIHTKLLEISMRYVLERRKGFRHV